MNIEKRARYDLCNMLHIICSIYHVLPCALSMDLMLFSDYHCFLITIHDLLRVKKDSELTCAHAELQGQCQSKCQKVSKFQQSIDL